MKEKLREKYIPQSYQVVRIVSSSKSQSVMEPTLVSMEIIKKAIQDLSIRIKSMHLSSKRMTGSNEVLLPPTQETVTLVMISW